MRKRTVRSGMRLLLAALLLIILASFYHAGMADLFSFSSETELRFYSLGMFIAAAIGGYGVVLAVFGFVLPANHRDDAKIRIAPLFFVVLCAVVFFFYLFVRSLTSPAEEERIRPGTTITI
jgi:nitrate/nitrite transporter NarK